MNPQRLNAPRLRLVTAQTEAHDAHDAHDADDAPTTRRYPRTTGEAFPRTVEYANAIEGPDDDGTPVAIGDLLMAVAMVFIILGAPFVWHFIAFGIAGVTQQ